MTRQHNDANHMRRKKYDVSNRLGQLERIYVRDKGICQLCFEPCLREEASRDHIIELKDCTTKEQARDDDNMRLAHVRCNNQRSNSPHSYIGLALPAQRKVEPKPLTHTMAEQLRALGLYEVEDENTITKWHNNI